MQSKNQKYDLIFSLGGTCATSKQLRYRKLQFKSFPFDWLFHVDERLFLFVADYFKTGFKDWFKKENLQELSADERGNSKHDQYKDIVSGFRFIHDFFKKYSFDVNYYKANRKYQRRIKRLLKYIKKSNTILMIADIDFEVVPSKLSEFINTVQSVFPQKTFDLLVIGFNAKESMDASVLENCRIVSFTDDRDEYNYIGVCDQFYALDEVQLSIYGKYILQNRIFAYLKMVLTRRIYGKIRKKIIKFRGKCKK